MKKIAIFILLLISIIAIIFFMNMEKKPEVKNISKDIRYVALGDSYTIGSGVDKELNFPSLLVDHLTKDGFQVTVYVNPSVSGFTTQQLIDYELSIFNASEPNLVTLLIGANDIAIESDDSIFRNNYRTILDKIRSKLPDKKRLIVLTIPDFSITSVGKQYSIRGDIQGKIKEYNEFIKSEAKKQGLEVVDLFELTKEMGKDTTLILDDGLHPSAKEYKRWEEKIYPSVLKVLKE